MVFQGSDALLKWPGTFTERKHSDNGVPCSTR